jgi:hypothetical protein
VAGRPRKGTSGRANQADGRERPPLLLQKSPPRAYYCCRVKRAARAQHLTRVSLCSVRCHDSSTTGFVWMVGRACVVLHCIGGKGKQGQHAPLREASRVGRSYRCARNYRYKSIDPGACVAHTDTLFVLKILSGDSILEIERV